VIVDAYNLIHRSPALKPGPDRTLEESRTKLINLLSWVVGTGEVRFLVVFDGDRGPQSEEIGARVTVRYSKLPQKADDVIRSVVEEQVDRVERVTVVTSDLEVARHARAMGATVALSDLFLGSVLGPGRSESAESEKPAGLSKREVEEWAALFRAQRSAEADESEPS